MKQIEDRVAVVTGAGSGIGKALAMGFAHQKAKVVLADVQEDALEAAVNDVRATGAQAIGVLTDVTDSDSVARLSSLTLERFGEVHILCNNAGVGGGGFIKNQQLVDWKWVIDVSLWGVIHGIHHFLPHLIKAEESHVMSTASVAGLMAVPGLAPYNAAKYGVVAIMETLHHEMERDPDSDVGVSVLCPGTVRTNIATAQRNRPDELKRNKKNVDVAATRAPEEARKRNAAIAAMLEGGMNPDDVAGKVIDAMLDNQFWILSHPEHLEEINHRNQQLANLENPTLISTFGE